MIEQKQEQKKKVLPFKMLEATYQHLDEESGGACVRCGGVQFETEPDARQYECEGCGQNGVYGFQELMMMGRIVLVDKPEEESVSW